MAEKNSTPQPSLLTLPNLLTIARMLILPAVIIGIVSDRGLLAVICMAVILLTDLLDGRIARRLKCESTFGGTLDSTIDFVIIYSLFIAFYAAGRLHSGQFIIIYIAMLAAFMLQLGAIAGKHTEGLVRSRSGKLTGALQYFYLLFLVAQEVLPDTPLIGGIDSILFALLALSIFVSSLSALLKIIRFASHI